MSMPALQSRDLSDEDLMAALIQDQSAEAFSSLVQRHAMRFRQVAYRYTGAREEAEDIVQNAFLKLWKKPTLWDSEKSVKFTTWFYRVVVNECLDLRRKNRTAPLPEEDILVDARLSQEEAYAEKQKIKLVEAAFQTLSHDKQVSLNLGFYDPVPNREAATLMGLSLKAYQSLLMRAKKELRDAIETKMKTRTRMS